MSQSNVAERDVSPRRPLPLGATAGALTVLLYATFTAASFALYPLHFRITENYLSDLGSSAVNPHGACVYNVGIALAGVSLLPFFAGFAAWRPSARWRTRLLVVTQLLGFVEAFALVMIGVYPENTGAPHVLWSNIQFFVNLLVLSLGTAALVPHPRFLKPIGVYSIVAIATQLAALVLIFLGSSSPLVEWLAVSTTLVFVGLVSFNMSKL